VIAVGASLLTLASIAFAIQVYRNVGLLLFNEQFLAGMLALGCVGFTNNDRWFFIQLYRWFPQS
jgi:hypothetical protein